MGPSATRLPMDTGGSGDDIVVASFDFPESALLAELYAAVLEEEGYPVTRLINLGSRETVDPALFQGLVDFVPEYAGTALVFSTLGRSAPSSDAQDTVNQLATALRPKGVSVPGYAAAQNQNGFVVTQETADRLGLVAISDLKDEAESLTFGGPPECPERPLCLAGLEQHYGLNFQEFLSLDASGPATTGALQTGEVDVALLFTTDPDIAAHDLVLLEDDRELQPAENVVPIVRSVVLDRYGSDFSRAIRGVTLRLSTPELRTLNRSTEVEGRRPRHVAGEWLTEQGLIE
jgi:osmoprotectant transport system substrate-binding protein